MLEAGEATDCWFDEPDPADRRSWAIPPGHGIYQGLDLELLDPADEDELPFLIAALDADVRLTSGHDLGSVGFETHAA
jgi:hypothetical protein